MHDNVKAHKSNEIESNEIYILFFIPLILLHLNQFDQNQILRNTKFAKINIYKYLIHVIEKCRNCKNKYLQKEPKHHSQK